MIFLVSKVFDADIFEHRTYARIISGMKDEIISFSLLIENVGKELGERAVRSHGLKKGRLKSGRTMMLKAVLSSKMPTLCTVFGGMMQISPVHRACAG